MGKLEGTVVVVTGASSGIGRATALAFARRRATLVVTARRREPLDTLADECRDAGAEAVLTHTGDVADADTVEALARQVVEQYGHVDVWVNNAAVNVYGRLEEIPVADWHRVVETNLFGTYHGARAVLPWFREQGGGVLINVSSGLGKFPAPYQSAYVASKYGIRAVSAALRQETRDLDDLHVCTILPGPIDTPIFRHAGNYTGWRVKPLEPVIDAGRVARAIVRCARKPQPEVAIGASTRVGLFGARATPRFTERAAAAQTDTDHFADEPDATGPGNVHDPAASWSSIDGGWRNGDGRQRWRTAGKAAGTAGVIGAAALAVTRRAGR